MAVTQAVVLVLKQRCLAQERAVRIDAATINPVDIRPGETADALLTTP
jgi:hypothetical protein